MLVKSQPIKVTWAINNLYAFATELLTKSLFQSKYSGLMGWQNT